MLTQIDQLADDAAQQQVSGAIAEQAAGPMWLAVSSTRYRLGVDGAKQLLLERSGIPALQQSLQHALAQVPQARSHEKALLLQEIRSQLQALHAERQQRLAQLRQLQAEQGQRFASDLAAVQDKTGRDIHAVLDVPGPDHSRTPDSFADQFKMTPGKLERNRLQVAYSKACISISAIPTKHGVVELPLEQQTQVKSLDSVMVAVMGVSVKYRQDMRRLFCEAAGRNALAQAFTRYFERSADRQALVQRMANQEARVQASAQALTALSALEALETRA
ncbi:hypothetical protein [Comamonas sp. JNW]|uniref:hypothetical protein n=1 Tax=Comamonas sp. JNW TaxID=2170731 RepID=UPI00105828AE|nr:hypothetical protein [Comamonas sp. JNW]